ncbi:hypothetical protein NDU88_005197, partial [Pleurodeles waltl]
PSSEQESADAHSHRQHGIVGLHTARPAVIAEVLFAAVKQELISCAVVTSTCGAAVFRDHPVV